MKRAFGQAAALLVISATATILTWLFHPKAPALFLYQEPPAEGEVTILEAREMEHAGGVLWIDARSRTEFDKEHVPGAHLLNEAEWESLAFQMVDVLTSNTKPVVIYCDAQRCEQAHRIAEKLRDLGNNDIHVLRGGWQAWKNAPR
jgi:rhodanese-related sulfurtransferase